METGSFTWTPPVAATPVEGSLPYELTFRASDGIETGVANTRLELAITDGDTLQTSAFSLLVTNAGQTGFQSRSLRGGLFYPPSASSSILFGAGPWFGGKVGTSVRMSRGGGDTEFAPGAIVGGSAVPFEPRFRNYRLERGDVLSTDYLSWPVLDGAPITGDGSPRIEGKSLIWSLGHDLNSGPRSFATEYWAPSLPLGVELRQTTFVYGGAGPLAKLAIVRYRLTNRSTASIESTYVGAFADPDIGNPVDDLAGYDRALEMGYVYNSTAYDYVFAASPPALGVVWLGGSANRSPVAPFRRIKPRTSRTFPSRPPDLMATCKARTRSASRSTPRATRTPPSRPIASMGTRSPVLDGWTIIPSTSESFSAPALSLSIRESPLNSLRR